MPFRSDLHVALHLHTKDALSAVSSPEELAILSQGEPCRSGRDEGGTNNNRADHLVTLGFPFACRVPCSLRSACTSDPSTQGLLLEGRSRSV